MLDEVIPYVSIELSPWEVYGLFFLMGSFAVATLSDVKHMSAQREFMDVWWVFAAVILAIQAWASGLAPTGPLVLKWIFVVALAFASHRRVGLWLRLATADVAAATAAAVLLSPGLVLAFWLLLKAISYPAAALLARGRQAYPFMPVIAAATLLIVGGAVLGGVIET